MSSQALQKTSYSDAVLQVAGEAGWDANKVQLIKDTVAKETTDDELMLFMMTAKRTGLDPFARQIYCIKRNDRMLGRKVASIQTSIDGYRLIADRTNKYAPGQEPIYRYTDDGHLISATSYVKKLAGGTWHEVAATAYYDEYAQETPLWKRMPRNMLAKCAEALALRRAFPAELSGLYTSDEFGNDAGHRAAESIEAGAQPEDLDAQIVALCRDVGHPEDKITKHLQAIRNWPAAQKKEHIARLIEQRDEKERKELLALIKAAIVEFDWQASEFADWLATRRDGLSLDDISTTDLHFVLEEFRAYAASVVGAD